MEIIPHIYDRWVSAFEMWGGLRRNTSFHSVNSVKKSTNLRKKNIVCVGEPPWYPLFIQQWECNPWS